MLAVVSLIVALAGVGTGVFSFISLNVFTNDMDTYINDMNTYINDLNTYINEMNTFINDTNAYINETNAYVLPMARVYYGGSTYTIPSGGGYQLFDYDQKSYDTHGAFNLTSDSYTIPEPGFYLVTAQYTIDAVDGGYFIILLYKNTDIVSFRASTSSTNTNSFGVALTDIINFDEGDSLTIAVYQYDPGLVSRNIYNGEALTFFAIAKIA